MEVDPLLLFAVLLLIIYAIVGIYEGRDRDEKQDRSD